jgi:hypothetical protein
MDTQNSTSYDKSQVVGIIKNFLAQYDKASGKKNKIILTKYFTNYLTSVKQFILDYPKFKITVINKMNEIKLEISELFNDEQYNTTADKQILNDTIVNIDNLLKLIS